MTTSKPTVLYQLPPTPLARVLLVDDMPEIVDLLAFSLAGQGFELARAFDGRQALRAARYFRPHVIVLNVLMPGMDGIEALGALRVDPELYRVKVIMTSALPYRDLCMGEGADAFLEKPFRVALLGDEIRRLLA